MTEITKPIIRKTKHGLPPNHGSDRGKQLVASLDVGDVLTLRVSGRRQVETFSLFDLYTMAVRNRVRRAAAEKEAKKREKRASKIQR